MGGHCFAHTNARSRIEPMTSRTDLIVLRIFDMNIFPVDVQP